jgi:multidrug efflux system membrane fusion protein
LNPSLATNPRRRTFRCLALPLLLSLSGSSLAASLDATLEWAERTELATPLSGVVAEVKAVAGAQVTKGQLLARLDDRGWRADLARAEAALDEAEAHKEEADRELERNQELYDRTVLSDHDLRMAEIEAARANAGWRLAQAELTHARLELERSRISAPFDGRILAVLKRPGEVVVNRLRADPMVVIAARDQLLASAPISAAEAARLRIGDAVRIEHSGGSIDGQIAAITQESDGMQLKVRFRQPAGSPLSPGQTVRLQLP